MIGDKYWCGISCDTFIKLVGVLPKSYTDLRQTEAYLDQDDTLFGARGIATTRGRNRSIRLRINKRNSTLTFRTVP